MNKYNGLLSSVAHKHHICKGARETENEWKTRLVYSICGSDLQLDVRQSCLLSPVP